MGKTLIKSATMMLLGLVAFAFIQGNESINLDSLGIDEIKSSINELVDMPVEFKSNQEMSDFFLMKEFY